MCKFLSGIFEKSRNSLLLLGIDSRHYACIRGGYIALKERAQPFSKIPLILAYGLQDATVLSKGSPLGEEIEGTKYQKKHHKICIYAKKAVPLQAD